MRVLAIGNAYPPHHLGGYEIIWRGATRHLSAEGHATRVLTTDYRAPGVGAEVPDDPGVHRELEWYSHDHAWRSMTPLQRLGLERRNAARLEGHLREFRPDVVASWAVGGMSLSLIERVRRIGLPSLFFMLDYWPTYGPRQDDASSMAAALSALAAEEALRDRVREGGYETAARNSEAEFNRLAQAELEAVAARRTR